MQRSAVTDAGLRAQLCRSAALSVPAVREASQGTWGMLVYERFED